MKFPVLQNYLARLSDPAATASTIWLDSEGRALGRFFNCTMTSAFQPVRQLDTGRVFAYEGLARSVSTADEGLSLWKLLDHAASDDESVELDRLCRMLHAINFFRQNESGDAVNGGADLYLNVHDRLLSAVSSNHGYAFQRILDALGLPIGRVVLQLPQVNAQQGWLLNYVSDNYRRNGFRFAVNVSGGREGLNLLERVRPDVVKVDARALHDEAALVELLLRSASVGAQLVFKRLEEPQVLSAVRRIGELAGLPVLGQGYLLDNPRPALLEAAAPRQLAA
ncbi:EAL domain-containing protein [Pseudoduganella violacea]|uniref:EAL domain-containing protein (Putative c-di-GMP-specific phosphodiesterase class I) n=1 Tax=Pseudoduganella violacea TaxID=1715466 RepID=A0A7W5FVH1_9BURK|nr:EAL domain-containing protein [Pseudoduganella violacea]MBB3120799.1 EAL domain-containing protein (putative c-di-GMP-specific phosphodiesterase class I) [Pseudoduganella violacea]